MRCRVLPFERGDGPWNMALDQWMLESAIADSSAAIVRTYAWAVPTLSLGYFQRLEDARSEARWADAPLVRRATGGGAIWHDRELTYTVALPNGHPLARRSTDLYGAVHRAIAGLLVERGIPAGRRGEAGARHVPDRPLLCFQDRAADDLLVEGTKVLGSAQRRRSGALWQHGSLLLAASPTAPELRGISDLNGASEADDPETWVVEVQDRIVAALGFEADVQGLTELERAVVARIAEDYRDPSWTARR